MRGTFSAIPGQGIAGYSSNTHLGLKVTSEKYVIVNNEW